MTIYHWNSQSISTYKKKVSLPAGECLGVRLFASADLVGGCEGRKYALRGLFLTQDKFHPAYYCYISELPPSPRTNSQLLFLIVDSHGIGSMKHNIEGTLVRPDQYWYVEYRWPVWNIGWNIGLLVVLKFECVLINTKVQYANDSCLVK